MTVTVTKARAVSPVGVAEEAASGGLWMFPMMGLQLMPATPPTWQLLFTLLLS